MFVSTYPNGTDVGNNRRDKMMTLNVFLEEGLKSDRDTFGFMTTPLFHSKQAWDVHIEQMEYELFRSSFFQITVSCSNEELQNEGMIVGSSKPVIKEYM